MVKFTSILAIRRGASADIVFVIATSEPDKSSPSLLATMPMIVMAQLPNEVAAAMVWNSTLDEWRLAARESITANGGYVSYREVELQDGEELIVDLHSHGHHPAYFSEIDNNDDFGSIKIAAVMGCVGSESTEIVARLMLIDKTIDLVITSSGGWASMEKT